MRGKYRVTVQNKKIKYDFTLKLTLYLPESFEWLILRSDIIDDKEIKEVLEEPWKLIDSEEYVSWERFFTSLLVRKTQDTYLQYNKRMLNPTYLHTNV